MSNALSGPDVARFDVWRNGNDAKNEGPGGRRADGVYEDVASYVFRVLNQRQLRAFTQSFIWMHRGRIGVRHETLATASFVHPGGADGDALI